MATIKKMKKIKKEKGVESDDQKHVDALRAAASELYKAWKVRGATAAARAAVPPCAVLTSASCGGLLTSVVFVFVCVCVCACCRLSSPPAVQRKASAERPRASCHRIFFPSFEPLFYLQNHLGPASSPADALKYAQLVCVCDFAPLFFGRGFSVVVRTTARNVQACRRCLESYNFRCTKRHSTILNDVDGHCHPSDTAFAPHQPAPILKGLVPPCSACY